MGMRRCCKRPRENTMTVVCFSGSPPFSNNHGNHLACVGSTSASLTSGKCFKSRCSAARHLGSSGCRLAPERDYWMEHIIESLLDLPKSDFCLPFRGKLLFQGRSSYFCLEATFLYIVFWMYATNWRRRFFPDTKAFLGDTKAFLPNPVLGRCPKGAV